MCNAAIIGISLNRYKRNWSISCDLPENLLVLRVAFLLLFDINCHKHANPTCIRNEFKNAIGTDACQHANIPPRSTVIILLPRDIIFVGGLICLL